MPTQRLTVATFAGRTAVAVAARFERWRAAPEPAAVDRLCVAIREHALSLPVVYFAEWIDRWLMGDTIFGPAAVVRGRRFDAACLSPEQAVAWAGRCGRQFLEHEWLAYRLCEAAGVWDTVAERYAVILREVSGPVDSKDEEDAALGHVPDWLTSLDE